MTLPETLRGEIIAVRDSVPYARTTFVAEKSSGVTVENTRELPRTIRAESHARRYQLRELARTVINSGIKRVPDLKSISRRIIRERFSNSHENNHRLGVAHNNIIVERLTNQGGLEHHNIMHELVQIVANDKDALSTIKNPESKL